MCVLEGYQHDRPHPADHRHHHRPHQERRSAYQDYQAVFFRNRLFHIVEQAPGEFDAVIAVQTAPAGSKLNDAALIRWLTDQLHEPATLVGWRLADGVVPALLAAATNASPQEDRAFVDALAGAVGTGAIDLADRFGGVAAPSLHAACKESTIPTIAPVAAMLADHGPVRDRAICAMLAANAAATLRLWANGSPERADALHKLAVGTLDAWRAAAAENASG